MAEQQPLTKEINILRLKYVMERTGLSRSTIYDKMDLHSPRYDPTFPRKIGLGSNSVGWSKTEVDAWLESCAANTNKSGTSDKKSRSFPSRQNFEGAGSTKSATVLSKSKSKSTSSRASVKRSAKPTNLAEIIVHGGKINARILSYLQLKTWTPVMAALLISGIEPPPDCREIPGVGIGLDEMPLIGGNSRFHDARRIL